MSVEKPLRIKRKRDYLSDMQRVREIAVEVASLRNQIQPWITWSQTQGAWIGTITPNAATRELIAALRTGDRGEPSQEQIKWLMVYAAVMPGGVANFKPGNLLGFQIEQRERFRFRQA